MTVGRSDPEVEVGAHQKAKEKTGTVRRCSAQLRTIARKRDRHRRRPELTRGTVGVYTTPGDITVGSGPSFNEYFE